MYQPAGLARVQGAESWPPARLGTLPDGRAGTISTLETMRNLVRDALRSPEQIVRNRAATIFRAAGVPPRAYRREAIALQKYVQQNVRYQKDPVGLELVQAPEQTLQRGYGDCDDQSTLLAALLSAAGHPSRFVCVAFKGGPLSHVLVETRIRDKWYAAETIIPMPFGWFPPNVTDRLTFKI